MVLISAGLGELVDGRDCKVDEGRFAGSSSSEESPPEVGESWSPPGGLGEPTIARRSAFCGLRECVWCV